MKSSVHHAFTLTFPERTNEWEEVDSLQVLRNNLTSSLMIRESEMGGWRYKISTHKQKYVYAKCSLKGCSAALRYRLEENGRLKLMKASCHHHHSLTQSRRFKFQAVINYLDSLPTTVPITTLRNAICPQFNLSEKQFYYIAAKLRSKPQLPDEFIRKLESEGYEVFTSSEPRLSYEPPQMLVLTNSMMQQSYKRWGDIVSFDLTFNLVKDIHSSGQRWKVGCLLVQNAAKKIIPVAVVATLHTTRQVYIQMFRTLFQALKGPPPVLVTDEEKALLSAIKELQQTGQFHGQHLLDPYHILHNIRKRLTEKENIILFSRLIHARNTAQFQAFVQQARYRIAQDQPILDRFLAKSNLYCFARISSQFLGFSISSSPNQCLHSVLKRMQPVEKKFSVAIRNCLQCCKALAKKSDQADFELLPLENVFQMPELKILRAIVCKGMMTRITEQLAHSMKLEVLETKADQLIIREHGRLYELNWKWRPSTEQPQQNILNSGGFNDEWPIDKTTQKKWLCNCGYQDKSLLPCRHQLRAIISKKETIMPYIATRWKIVSGVTSKEQNNMKEIRQRGRQRNSSRRFGF